MFLVMNYKESFGCHHGKLENWKNKVSTSLTEKFIFSRRVNEVNVLFFHNSIL